MLGKTPNQHQAELGEISGPADRLNMYYEVVEVVNVTEPEGTPAVVIEANVNV